MSTETDTTRPRAADPSAPGRTARRERRRAARRLVRAAAEQAEFRDDERFLDGIEARRLSDVARYKRDFALHALERLEDNVADALERELDHLSRARLAAGSGLHDEARKADQVARAAYERRMVDEERAAELRSLVTGVRPVDPYGKGSPHSWVADHLSGTPEARERLARAAQRAVLDDPVRARRQLETAHRSVVTPARAAEEVRAGMTTAAGSGGALVTPAYMTEWADYRTWPASFADACEQDDLPEHGMTVNVPYVSGGPLAVATVSTAQGAAFADTTLTGGYRTVAVATFAGGAKVSQQLLDRAGPTRFDQVLYAQAREELESALDRAVIAAAAGAATTALTRAAYSMAGFYSDAQRAGSSLETTAGVALPPSHAFLPPVLATWLQSQVDSTTDRPVWEPAGDSEPDVAGSGYSGYRVGSTAVYVDQNLTSLTTGTHLKWLVSAPARSVLVLRSEPVCQVIPETFAETLTALVRVYAYAAYVVRHPGGTATVTGAAYPAAPTWA